MVWPLWPGCAFLVGILLLVSRRIWPLLIAAGLAGFVLYDLQSGLTPRSIALLVLSDAVEVLITVVGLSYAFDGPVRLDSIKSLAKFSFVAVILAPSVAAFIATTAFDGNYWIRWRSGLFTEALALLTVTPAIVSWARIGQARVRKSRAFYLEEATMLGGITLVGYAAFVAPLHSTLPVVLYSLVPFLLWSAVRFGVTGISTSMMVVAFLAIWGAVHGHGPFTGAGPLDNVMSLQLFLFVAATTFMVLAVFVEEQKQLEQAFHESEKRFRLVADTAPVLIWMSDTDKLCTYFNKPWLDFTGRPIGLELGNGWAEGVHPDELRRCLETYTQAFDRREEFRMEYRLRRHDGEYRRILDIGVPRFNQDLLFAGYIGCCVDLTEGRQAEEALKKSEEKFSKIFQQSPMAMTVTSTKDHRYIEVNETFERLTGWRRDELIGRTPFDIELWVDPGERVETIKRLLIDGHVRDLETRFRMRDGSIRTCLATAEMIELNGEPCMLAVAADITGYKHAQEELRDSQQRISGIITLAMDSIISVDGQQRIVLFNAAAERMFRCSAAEAMGQPVERFIPEWLRSARDAHIRQPGETGVTNRAKGAMGSLCAVRADGEEFQIEASISQMEVRGNKLSTLILRDITERRLAEEALRTSEERFSKAFRSSPLAVTISTEAEGRYLDVNDAFLQMLGYQRQEVIGHTASELDFWAQPSERVEMIRQLGERGRVTGFQTQYTTSKGKKREAEVSAELVELDGQRCMLAIIRDITETQQLEAQFRQAQKMEAVGRLAGGMAHDFNNLLGVIIGYSDLSQSLITPESPVNRHLEQIKKASNRAVSLTRQLLAFSRQQVVFPKALDLNEVVRNMTNMLQRMVGEDVAISFRPILPIGSVHADPGQIEQVLMNLVVNARDAMPSGGQIVIETAHAEVDEHYVSEHPGSRTGQNVVLAVSDTGCGMSEEIKSQIFEPFFTTKEVGKGTGLGLSTVYGIVKQSGCYISVDSEPGKGTTFKIYFPRMTTKAEHLVESHEEPGFPGGSETILVVEDDEPLRDLAVRMLQDAGYRVVEAGNAEAALDTVKAANPRIDLLLTDMVMPGKSGFELLEQARAVDPTLRSLFMSGYTGDLGPQRGRLISEAAFLEKPFTRSSLLKKVRSALQVGPAKQQPLGGHTAGPGID
jgi:PAS domain S-box-containing protein